MIHKESTQPELWQPTLYLRWLAPKKEGAYYATDLVLQQKYISNQGNSKWLDVEITNEQ